MVHGSLKTEIRSRNSENRIKKGRISKSGYQEVGYQVNRISGLNIEIRSVYSCELVVSWI